MRSECERNFSSAARRTITRRPGRKLGNLPVRTQYRTQLILARVSWATSSKNSKSFTIAERDYERLRWLLRGDAISPACPHDFALTVRVSPLFCSPGRLGLALALPLLGVGVSRFGAPPRQQRSTFGRLHTLVLQPQDGIARDPVPGFIVGGSYVARTPHRQGPLELRDKEVEFRLERGAARDHPASQCGIDRRAGDSSHALTNEVTVPSFQVHPEPTELLLNRS